MTARHIPALDGLRGIAILLVLLHNAHYFPGGAHGLLWAAGLVSNAGWIGVPLFFVLSGFLITRQLLDSQGSSNYYRVFFARRVLRIFPLYYTALLVALVVFPLAFPAAVGGAMPGWDQIWLWTFLSNWAGSLGAAHYGMPHFWSLAVEEQFYLIWPFVVHRLDAPRLVKVGTWIVLAALTIRGVMVAAGASVQMVYEYTVCRMDALAIGAIAAALLRITSLDARARALAPWLLPLAAAAALAGALITRAYTLDLASTLTLGQSLLALCFGLLLLACVIERGAWNRRLQRLLSLAPLRSVGKYSYGMYVVHYPIIKGLAPFVPRFQSVFGPQLYIVPLMALITLASYALAFLSYHLLEKHFLRLKRGFLPTRVSGPAFETS
jgi:peptidoglycan/LPS O-acetylase OafA/YrhL